MKHRIVEATLDDLDELVTISRETFTESFGWYNTRDNMQYYLQNDMGEGILKAELENKDVTFFLLKEDKQVIGYMKIGYDNARPDLDLGAGIEIERIYILKSHHRKGLGKLLLDKAIQLAHEGNCDYIWLAVWELNTNAIEFYKSQGFVTFGTKNFVLGKDVQKDICMKLDVKRS